MSGIFRSIKGLDPKSDDLWDEPVKEEAMSEPWDAITHDIVGVIEERAKSFLDENAEAKDFVLERAKRLAQLLFEYKLAADDAEILEKKEKMELVQSTIETELAALALNGQAAAKETFREVVKTAFGILIKAIPSLIAAI